MRFRSDVSIVDSHEQQKEHYPVAGERIIGRKQVCRRAWFTEDDWDVAGEMLAEGVEIEFYDHLPIMVYISFA